MLVYWAFYAIWFVLFYHFIVHQNKKNLTLNAFSFLIRLLPMVQLRLVAPQRRKSTRELLNIQCNAVALNMF